MHNGTKTSQNFGLLESQWLWLIGLIFSSKIEFIICIQKFIFRRKFLVVTALIAALNHVKAYLQDADLKRVSDFRIVLISNLAGLPKIEDCAQMLQYLADGFSKTGASLTIVYNRFLLHKINDQKYDINF